MNTQDQISRIRVQYTKGHGLRFTGHLDLQRIWERLLRRSELPLRYSQGYHPRARINLASALPLGCISESELLDFWMEKPLPPGEILSRLSSASIPDIEFQSVRIVDLREKSLQSQLYASEFEVQFFDPQNLKILQDKISESLAREAIIRTRRNKTYDLLPLILNLEIVSRHAGEIGLKMRLKAEQGATGRPDEVLDELGYTNTEYLVKRTKLILSSDKQ